MKYSRRKILKALKIISNVCLNKDCDFCPFGGHDEKGVFCLIMDAKPFNWEIGDTCNSWKALAQRHARRSRGGDDE